MYLLPFLIICFCYGLMFWKFASDDGSEDDEQGKRLTLINITKRSDIAIEELDDDGQTRSRASSSQFHMTGKFWDLEQIFHKNQHICANIQIT